MNEYQMAGVIGCILAIAWLAGLVLIRIGYRAWAWVDDSEPPKINPFIKWLMHKDGWVERASCDYPFIREGEISDGIYIKIRVFFAAALLPVIAVLALQFYPVTLAMATMYAIAHLARYARRHKKVFDEHVADKKAHEDK